jgi:hypothetical protein
LAAGVPFIDYYQEMFKFLSYFLTIKGLN